MAQTLTEKIITAHLKSGKPLPGEEIGIKIDQTLTQDATGTLACLQFEALGIPRVKTEISVSYVDHNTLQSGFENADDHRFLASAAARFGLHFSRPGNGICHQVHLERFGVPGRTLLGSDSHTPTGGGLGMLAIGAGGLDVAVAMGGGLFYTTMPKIVGVKLSGKLPPWVAAKDVILEVLRRKTVKGGVGSIFEYFGPGVETLSVPERATITNMGAELGATTSLFPSDERTKEFLAAQGRARKWRELAADAAAQYEEVLEIDLSSIEPLVARPSSPDAVVPVREVAGTEISQVCIGSCTNSSLRDLLTVAAILKGKTVAPNVSLAGSPGSKQVLTMIAKTGALAEIVSAGARVLECTCGPCIGMGQSPPTGGASMRTFNRNFPGRSGTKPDAVYLVSPETAAASALAGKMTDPRDLGEAPDVKVPKRFLSEDNMIVPPLPREKAAEVELVRGPNIAPLPAPQDLPGALDLEVLLKVGDNITTDHIMPAGAKILPLRSNIPKMAEHVYEQGDAAFASRAKEAGGGFIVGGVNYGQGSSREHAALAPMHLGVRAVMARDFARIHKANLVNFGVLPLVISEATHRRLEQGDRLRLDGLRSAVESDRPIVATRLNTDETIELTCELSDRERDIVLAGGRLNHIRSRQQ